MRFLEELSIEYRTPEDEISTLEEMFMSGDFTIEEIQSYLNDLRTKSK